MYQFIHKHETKRNEKKFLFAELTNNPLTYFILYKYFIINKQSVKVLPESTEKFSHYANSFF